MANVNTIIHLYFFMRFFTNFYIKSKLKPLQLIIIILVIMGCGVCSNNLVTELPLKNHSQYQLNELIDVGTISKVYKCQLIDNQHKQQLYCMKIIPFPTSRKFNLTKQVKSLKSEIEVWKQLNHPNIIKYQSIQISNDEHNNKIEVVMDRVQGKTLKKIIRQKGKLSESEVIKICKDILHGLQFLHQEKIIHKDLKSSNIIINKQDKAIITDYGISYLNYQAIYGDSLPQIIKNIPPYYKSPEIINQNNCFSYSADIWSFGCVVIEMLTGDYPWGALTNNSSQITQFLKATISPPLPPLITKTCKQFLQFCLQSIPSKRLTASQLLRHIFLNDKPHQKITVNEKSQRTIIQQSSEKITQNENVLITKPIVNIQKRQNKYKKEKKSNVDRMMTQPFERVGNKPLDRIELNNEDAIVIDLKEQHKKALEGLYYIKKLQQAKRKNNKIQESNIQIMITEQDQKPNNNEYWNRLYRSKTQSGVEEDIINSLVAKAQRNRYQNQRKKQREQRQNEKKKWEEQLKQGAEIIKKEIKSKYQNIYQKI